MNPGQDNAQMLVKSIINDDNILETIQVKDLCISFGGEVVLDHLNFSIRRGDIIFLRGQNGSGKSTLLNILTGALVPNKGIIEIKHQNKTAVFNFNKPYSRFLNRFKFTPQTLANFGISRTWQDIKLFKTQTVYDNIAVASQNQMGESLIKTLFLPNNHKIQEEKIKKQVEQLLKFINFETYLDLPASKISLGQSKRVAIARCLQAGAKILFLDEPLSGLDKKGISDILQLLKVLISKEHITLIIVEHAFNANRIIDFANTIWTLQDGKLTDSNTDRFLYHQIQSNLDEFLSSYFTTVKYQSLFKRVNLTTFSQSENYLDVILEIKDLVVFRDNRLVLGEDIGQDNINSLNKQILNLVLQQFRDTIQENNVKNKIIEFFNNFIDSSAHYQDKSLLTTLEQKEIQNQILAALVVFYSEYLVSNKEFDDASCIHRIEDLYGLLDAQVNKKLSQKYLIKKFNILVKGISLKIARDSKTSIYLLKSPNGWGKTTLFESISGLIPIERGEIRFNDEPIQDWPVWKRVKAGINFLQSRDENFLNLTVREFFSLARVSKPIKDLESYWNKKIGDLSGGQKRRVAIYFALNQPGQLIILDEVFSALDDKSCQSVMNIIKKSQKTILLLEPDQT